jgi:hypothetical protein
MNITKAFINDFKPSYLRNNRRGGQKNIRCFPACSHDGHKCAGFCGQAVKLAVSTNTCKTTVAVAEFVQVDNGNNASKQKKKNANVAARSTSDSTNTDNTALPIQVGTVVPKEYLSDNVRVKKDPLRRFINGNKVQETVDATSSSFTCDFLPTCWHYSWRSNKHSTNKQHCLRVYLFQGDDAASDKMKCVDVYDSPTFSLFSSKQLDNYAKEGKIPNGAVALFHARQKASAEKLYNKANGSQKTAKKKKVTAKKNGRKSCSIKKSATTSVLKKRKAMMDGPIKASKFGGCKKAKIEAIGHDGLVSFPYDAMIADCLGIERGTSLSKVEMSAWNGNKDENDMVDELDLFDLGPGELKHASSFTALNEFDVDDYFTTTFNNINSLKRSTNDMDITIDYSSETSESSQGSIFHTSSEDDECESDLDALWY